MKLFNVSWLDVLTKLPAFSALERSQKLVLLQAKPSGDQPLELLQGQQGPLESAGLIRQRVRQRAGPSFAVAESWRAGQRVVRAMDRSLVLDSSLGWNARHNALMVYLAEHYADHDIQELSEQRAYTHRSLLAELVADFSWVEGFLDPGDSRFPNRKRRLDACLPETVELARQLARELGQEGPVRMADLAQRLDSPADEDLARAIDFLLREVLVFAALDDDLEPILGLWPSTVERLSEPPVELRVFEDFAGASFSSPFMIHDAATVLVACLGEPARLKADYGGIFARDLRRIESQLAPLPEWFGWKEQDLGPEIYPSEQRVATAVRFATELELAEGRGLPGRDYRLEVTDLGRDWLAETEAQRQRYIYDVARVQLPQPGVPGEARRNRAWDEFDFFPPLRSYGVIVPVRTSVWQRALIEANTRLGEREVVLLGQFLAEGARVRNPFKNISTGRSWNYQPEQALENLWANTLFQFFSERLLPLGAVEVGFVSDDDTLAFRLTETGRFLLGEIDDFPEIEEAAATEVIVQPNFEVVFMAPSVEAEAKFMQFAEQTKSRKEGSRVGLLFELTRESVLRGASSGLDGDAMISTLRQLSSSELPENVEHQVRAWANQVRTLEGRHAFLLDCRDLETANRVLAALGKKARPISETVVEVETGPMLSMPLRKKLREAGLFVRERESD